MDWEARKTVPIVTWESKHRRCQGNKARFVSDHSISRRLSFFALTKLRGKNQDFLSARAHFPGFLEKWACVRPNLTPGPKKVYFTCVAVKKPPNAGLFFSETQKLCSSAQKILVFPTLLGCLKKSLSLSARGPTLTLAYSD